MPLKIDKVTSSADFGHYAHILVDIDLASSLPDSFLIERVGKSFFIEVAYENLPSFFHTYSNIGHLPRDHRLNKNLVQVESNPPKPDKPNGPNRVWKRKSVAKESNMVQQSSIPLINAFDYLKKVTKEVPRYPVLVPPPSDVDH